MNTKQDAAINAAAMTLALSARTIAAIARITEQHPERLANSMELLRGLSRNMQNARDLLVEAELVQ